MYKLNMSHFIFHISYFGQKHTFSYLLHQKGERYVRMYVYVLQEITYRPLAMFSAMVIPLGVVHSENRLLSTRALQISSWSDSDMTV